MKNTSPHYLTKLKEALFAKQRTNPSFSLRAYARFLKIHPPTLSAVLNKKRPLSFKSASQITERLQLSPKEKALFLRSVREQKKSLNDINLPLLEPSQILNDESHYKVIAEWEHYAILSLMETEGFVSTSDQAIECIAKRLGITALRASTCVENLLETGLIVKNKSGSLTKTHGSVCTTEDIVSSALQKSHKENFELANKKLESTPVELRDYSSITLSLDPDLLTEAKQVIRRFRKELSSLVEAGRSREVYQLSVQLFPLSELNLKPKTNQMKEKSNEKPVH